MDELHKVKIKQQEASLQHMQGIRKIVEGVKKIQSIHQGLAGKTTQKE